MYSPRRVVFRLCVEPVSKPSERDEHAAYDGEAFEELGIDFIAADETPEVL